MCCNMTSDERPRLISSGVGCMHAQLADHLTWHVISRRGGAFSDKLNYSCPPGQCKNEPAQAGHNEKWMPSSRGRGNALKCHKGWSRHQLLNAMQRQSRRKNPQTSSWLCWLRYTHVPMRQRCSRRCWLLMVLSNERLKASHKAHVYPRGSATQTRPLVTNLRSLYIV